MFLAPSVLAQTDPLAAWHGEWKGTCALIPAYRGTDRFEASLRVQPMALAGRYGWRLIYEASPAMQRSVRDYMLEAVDAARGHYVLDERNGLKLDSFLSGRAIYTHFAIGRSTLPVTYVLLSDTEMMIDLPSFETKPARRTCLTSDPYTCVDSYRLQSAQRCSLHKTNP